MKKMRLNELSYVRLKIKILVKNNTKDWFKDWASQRSCQGQTQTQTQKPQFFSEMQEMWWHPNWNSSEAFIGVGEVVKFNTEVQVCKELSEYSQSINQCTVINIINTKKNPFLFPQWWMYWCIFHLRRSETGGANYSYTNHSHSTDVCYLYAQNVSYLQTSQALKKLPGQELNIQKISRK